MLLSLTGLEMGSGPLVRTSRPMVRTSTPTPSPSAAPALTGANVVDGGPRGISAALLVETDQ